ncbi:MAG: hypothetical protein KF729_33470 [Sandaracinaceae bacterium]|nr:hypothetical protein [Sandaracinaceae bacterium]
MELARRQLLTAGASLGTGALTATGACLGALYGLEPESPASERTLLAFLIVATVACAGGAGVGGLGAWLLAPHGARGAVAFGAGLTLGLAIGIGAFLAISALPLHPDDVGLVTTSWLWGEVGWAGTVLYVVTFLIDIILLALLAVIGAIATLVVPPASGLCCALSTFALALAALRWFARREAMR